MKHITATAPLGNPPKTFGSRERRQRIISLLRGRRLADINWYSKFLTEYLCMARYYKSSE